MYSNANPFTQPHWFGSFLPSLAHTLFEPSAEGKSSPVLTSVLDPHQPILLPLMVLVENGTSRVVAPNDGRLVLDDITRQGANASLHATARRSGSSNQDLGKLRHRDITRRLGLNVFKVLRAGMKLMLDGCRDHALIFFHAMAGLVPSRRG